jgi:hypothetical protein
MPETNTFLKTPTLVFLAVVFVLILGAIFLHRSGRILSREYHDGNATVSGH